MASVKELIKKRVSEKLEELVSNKLIKKEIAKEILEVIENGKSNAMKIKDGKIYDAVLMMYLNQKEFTKSPSGKYNGSCDIINSLIRKIQNKVRKKIQETMDEVLNGNKSIEEVKKLKDELEQIVPNFKKFLRTNSSKFIKDDKINKKEFFETIKKFDSKGLIDDITNNN